MTASAHPSPSPAAPGARPTTGTPLLDWLFTSWWPDRQEARPRLLLAALTVGVLAAVVVPDRAPGIGLFGVFAAVAVVVASADRRLRTPARLVALALCLTLGSVVALRDADWIVVLCVLAALGLAATALLDVRSFAGVLEAAVAVPLSGVRGLPWLGRSFTAGRTNPTSWAVVRTVVLSVALVAVFGSLFASADVVFNSWIDAVVPNLTVDTMAARVVLLLGATGGTLAYAYVGLNPPRPVAPPSPRPVGRTFEWLLPVGLVVGLFAVFVLAQATVMFGGDEYLARTTGVTYADYVHQGFAQMCVATVLTLGVIGATVAKAPRHSARQRLQLRVALGLLCALALVVVGSALYRIHVYEEAYGFTRLRLLVTVFEGWLGLVLLLVGLAGVRLRAPWLPMATVVSAAVALLGLALLNPDAYIASRNVARYHDTGKIDLDYLGGLSADAAPALSRLPAGLAACVYDAPEPDDWLSWNLGRSRAADVSPPTAACQAVPAQ